MVSNNSNGQIKNTSSCIEEVMPIVELANFIVNKSALVGQLSQPKELANSIEHRLIDENVK